MNRLLVRYLISAGLILSSIGNAEDRPAFDDAGLEFFEKEVRPILVARCFECHSSTLNSPKGGLRLDSRDAILKGGDTGPAAIAGQPKASLLISAINYGDVYQMPPKSRLPTNEIAILTKWIESGLPWTKDSSASATAAPQFDLAARAASHWCWQPLKPVPPPVVKQTGWPLNDADRFILAALETKGLTPAARADKRILLRRLYFDLIGLPPSPDEVEQFAADTSPDPYRTVVDRLLDSPHFGERWARHWLDLCRYAETRGHEFEPLIPNAWQYRDYVIRALNADVPYDRFLTEQIAGDLIEPRYRPANSQSPAALPVNESLLGTAFWLLGEEVHSPVDIRKDETDRMDNRLDVLSKTFLGLTVACARCHDHKFDAISQRDYYALAGYAISSGYRQVRVDTLEQHRRIAQQLDEMRTRSHAATRKKLVEATRPFLNQLNRYLTVAVQAAEQGMTNGLAPDQPVSAKAVISVTGIALESALDPVRLINWCSELQSAKSDTRHPLHPLIAPTSGIVPAPVRAPDGLIADFGNPKTYPPIQDGVSFGLRPVEPGIFLTEVTAESTVPRIATIGGWRRDLFWNKIGLVPGTEVDQGTIGNWRPYGRMVRSPEFTLTSPRLWYLVQGSFHAYANVNSHLLVLGPLHTSLLRDFRHADNDWHWVSHELGLYQGHRMHVEFCVLDDHPCAIAQVVQSDKQPDLPHATFSQLRQSIVAANTLAQRVRVYQQSFEQVVNWLKDHDLENAGPLDLADWFVSHWRLFSTGEISLRDASLDAKERQLASQVQWNSSLAPAVLDGTGSDEFLLTRGNSHSPKERVPRRFLEVFDDAGQSSDPIPSHEILLGSGRLGLAKKILQTPLAARVAVNRIWHHLFGRGIVPTVDNLGVLGQPPSHPELLDALAAKFIRDGWSTKSMIRQLVLSQTYQMSSHPCPADEIDPQNELWHRMPLKRLEGEVIRDSMLAVSGRLDQKQFGPSVPVHLTEFMQGRGRPAASGPLDGNSRRSIYIAVRRNFLSPMMLAFDTPNPFSTVGRRTVSNVPAQALILMNDPFVIEQARHWADRILSDSNTTTEQRIDRLYLTAFARHPLPVELSDVRSFLSVAAQDATENRQDAWRSLCHVMFNVKEFIFVE